MQIRSVECVDLNGMHNTQCDPATRPNSMQSCSVGIPCVDDIMIAASTTPESYQEAMPSYANNDDDDVRDSIDKNFDDLTAEEEEDSDERENETSRQKPPPTPSRGDDETEEDEEDEDGMQADDPTERNAPFGFQYRMPRAERLIDPHKPNEPT
jgi:hypothetical protein